MLRALARAIGGVVFALACALAVIGFALAALTARVEGTSMTPTLRNGDLLLVNKFPGGQEPLRRGDIVLLRLGNANAVKRVIGLPGDELEIDHGQVLVKAGGGGPWRHLSEPYISSRAAIDSFCCDLSGRATHTGLPGAISIPPRRYFVLGDNRNDSYDSRVFGLVPQDWVAGRVLLRYWPPDRFGTSLS
ncbi:MAG: signal peptidase I [Actinobacteria bacterium]|nr:signal peptidase I [Actinomycetota bacterium]